MIGMISKTIKVAKPPLCEAKILRVKTVIAGGRDYRLTSQDVEELYALPISEVVSGGASGVDWEGEREAEKAGITIHDLTDSAE